MKIRTLPPGSRESDKTEMKCVICLHFCEEFFFHLRAFGQSVTDFCFNSVL